MKNRKPSPQAITELVYTLFLYSIFFGVIYLVSGDVNLASRVFITAMVIRVVVVLRRTEE